MEERVKTKMARKLNLMHVQAKKIEAFPTKETMESGLGNLLDWHYIGKPT